jgi:hypothetical protein
MQNKPNFRKSQMNVTDLLTRDYEKKGTWSSGKNKPNFHPKNQLPPQKQTQPVLSFVEVSNPTCSELACTERSRRVEPVEVSNLFLKMKYSGLARYQANIGSVLFPTWFTRE